MEYRSLGRSGLTVSILSLGTMTFGGSQKIGGLSAGDAGRLVDIALDRGVNLIDTADIYAGGECEEIVGSVLAEGGRRRTLLVATKMGLRAGDGPNAIGSSRRRIMQQVEASLRRMGLETIDLYQLHGWDGMTPMDETMEALDRLVSAGKIRYVGCSNFSAWHIASSLLASVRGGWQHLVAQQIHYTLHSREAEHELLPMAVDQGLGVLVWSPLAGGLLSGKYAIEGGPDIGRHVGGFPEPPVPDASRLERIVATLREVAGELEQSVAEVALAWLIGRTGITSVIVGSRNVQQLNENLEAASLRLSDVHRARLDEVSATPLPYPYWHQANSVRDRFGPADLALHQQPSTGLIPLRGIARR